MKVVSVDKGADQIVVELSRNDLSEIHNAMFDSFNEGMISQEGEALLDRFWEILRSFDEPDESVASPPSGVQPV